MCLYFHFRHENVEKTPEATIKEDHILNYQKANFTINLLLRNINDAIRQGDGERLINSYRLALLYFKVTGHHKYSYTILKLLYRIKLVPEDAFKLIWSRFVNTTGYKGRNISPDLHLEHLNNFLKELLRALRSNINETNAERVACSLKNIKLIIQNFESSIELNDRPNKKSTPSTFDDVKKLATAYNEAKVFEEKLGRENESYPKFKAKILDDLNTNDLYLWLINKEKEFTELYSER